ncbi:MAG: hypothetical protein M3552_00955 [Planctomycetota bacterium]|nr:hypothetical protein [Planctomycetota bacterium]
MPLLSRSVESDLPSFLIRKDNSGSDDRKISEETDRNAFFAQACRFRKISPNPQPIRLDGQGLPVVQQDGLADPAQSGQHHILQDDLLFEQLLEFIGLHLATSQIRRLVPSTRAEWILEPIVGHMQPY